MSDYAPHDVEWTPEKVGRIWSYYGGSPAHADAYFSRHSGARVVERLERDHGLAGKRILDFGCGRGDLLAHLYGRGLAASGLEFDETSAAEVRTRFAGEPLFGGVTVATDVPTPLPAGAFDRILLVEVVEHLLERQVAPTFAEVARLLAPGGRVIVTAPNEENLAAARTRCPDCGAAFHVWQHQRSLSVSSLSALAEAAGLVLVEAAGVNWGPKPRLARLRGLHRLLQPHLLCVAERR